MNQPAKQDPDRDMIRYSQTGFCSNKPSSVETETAGIWQGTLRDLCLTAYMLHMVELDRPLHEERPQELYAADDFPGMVEKTVGQGGETFTVRRDEFSNWLKRRAKEVVWTEREEAWQRHLLAVEAEEAHLHRGPAST